MKLIERYRRLTLWNKVGLWSAIASFVGLALAVPPLLSDHSLTLRPPAYGGNLEVGLSGETPIAHRYTFQVRNGDGNASMKGTLVHFNITMNGTQILGVADYKLPILGPGEYSNADFDLGDVSIPRGTPKVVVAFEHSYNTSPPAAVKRSVRNCEVELKWEGSSLSAPNAREPHCDGDDF